MPRYSPPRSDFAFRTISGKRLIYLKHPHFEDFNANLLGLGVLNQASIRTEAICAIFDLSGFTNFCRQSDPHLVVPEYLSKFIDWLLKAIKDNAKKSNDENGTLLYYELPFMAKFLGDGVMFLWDTKDLTPTFSCNIIVGLDDITTLYKRDFLPEIRKEVSEPPSFLRCGISRGSVFSVGDGNDFVGPCINMAARLQKLSDLTFVWGRRGFHPETAMHEKPLKNYILKKTAIRGAGENELVYLKRQEFENLSEDQKIFFKEP